MNIKLDENLPHQLVQLLNDLGHDVDTVPEEHIPGRDDDVVWAAAQTHLAESAFLSEAALAQDWDRPEEDEAWAHLQPAR